MAALSSIGSISCKLNLWSSYKKNKVYWWKINNNSNNTHNQEWNRSGEARRGCIWIEIYRTVFRNPLVCWGVWVARYQQVSWDWLQKSIWLVVKNGLEMAKKAWGETMAAFQVRHADSWASMRARNVEENRIERCLGGGINRIGDCQAYSSSSRGKGLGLLLTFQLSNWIEICAADWDGEEWGRSWFGKKTIHSLLDLLRPMHL